MIAGVLAPPKEETAPRQYEAADLDGELRADPVLSLFSAAELEQHALEAHETAERTMLLCCDFVVEYARRAGGGRLDRARALSAYRQLTGRSSWAVYQMLAVGRYWNPERRQLYPTLSYEVLAETVRHTHRDGDTPQAREERIAKVAREAADADLNVVKARELARSIDRPVLSSEGSSRGSFLELDSAPHPATQVEAAPPAQSASLCVEEMVPVLTRGLGKRLERDQPGTFPLVVECVERHLSAVLLDEPWQVTVSA
jgi:hypothetical protein